MNAEQKAVYLHENMKMTDAFLNYKQARMELFKAQFSNGTYNPIQLNALLAMEWVKMTPADISRY